MPSEVAIRQYTNVAGLALLIYDQVLTWDGEVNYIWRSSDWASKMMFFVGRYGALAIQIVNLVVTHPYFLEKHAIGCYKWFGFQTTTVCLLMLNLQLVLMLRVYALYGRSTKIAGFLTCWFLFCRAMMIWTGNKFVRMLKLDSSCMIVETAGSMATIPFSVICILDQCILWGLAAHKFKDAIRRGWSTNPIMHLVMRDTSWSCLAICCLFIATIPYDLRPVQIGHIIYSVLYCLVSILTCRTMINMRGLSDSGISPSVDVATVEMSDLE